MFPLDHSVAKSVYQRKKKPTLPIQELPIYIPATVVYLSLRRSFHDYGTSLPACVCNDCRNTAST